MENLYKNIVKITADILKSWTPDPGVVSPFSSSSSMHEEVSDNHLEHYVKTSEGYAESPDISSMFNSNLFTNGGEKMTEKTLDVNASETTENSYTNPGASTTEPDAQSAIAITKSAEMAPTTVGTTANTTTEAPSAGDTTEPVAKAADEDAADEMAKAADCPDCNKAMTLCECAGMTKAEGDKCSACGQAMPMKKAADEAEPAEEAAKETPMAEAKEMKKSLWDGAFAPTTLGKLS